MSNGSANLSPKALYRHVMEQEGLGHMGVAGFSQKMPMLNMIHDQAWLPALMLRADELCVAIYGGRMWDWVYVADIECIEGIRALPAANAKLYVEKKGDSAFNEKALQTYADHPVLDNLAPTEKFLLARTSLTQMIYITDTNEVEVRPTVRERKPDGSTLSNNDVLPFYSLEKLKSKWVSRMMQVMITEPDHSYELDLTGPRTQI